MNSQTEECVSLNFENENKVATLFINRQEKLNALNRDVLAQIDAQLKRVESAPGLVVLKLASAGEKAFVAGADISEMQKLSPHQAAEFALYGGKLFERISSLNAIVVAQVQGFALGGGCELALAADLIFASDKAQFGLPEVGLGLIPGFGGTQRLVKRVGYGRAMEMIAFAKPVSAAVAFSYGLVNEVVAHDSLPARVNEHVATILQRGPVALAHAKRAVKVSLDVPVRNGLDYEAALFGQCFGGAESREGMAAFLEKRKPQF